MASGSNFEEQLLPTTVSSSVALNPISWQILTKGLNMAASYTFSLTLVALGWMAGRMPGDQKNNLAASALLMSVLMTVAMLSNMPCFALSIAAKNKVGRLRQLESEEDSEQIRAQIKEIKTSISGLLRPGIYLLGLPGFIVALPVLLTAKSFLTLFGQSSAVTELVGDFLKIYGFSYIAGTLRILVEQLLFSFDRDKAAKYIGLFSFILGSSVAGALCFCTQLGFSGIAIGYLFEACLTATLFSLVLNGKLLNAANIFKDFKFFSALKDMRPWITETDKTVLNIDDNTTGLLITNAKSLFISAITEAIQPLVITVMAGRLGVEALAAQSLASWLVFVLMIPQLALAQSAGHALGDALGKAQQATKTSQVLSTNEYKRVTHAAYQGVLTVSLFMLSTCALFAAYPKAITYTITNNLENKISATGEMNVRITAVGIFFDAARNLFMQLLRHLGNNKVSTCISSLGISIGIISGASIACTTNWGIYGLSAGYATGNFIALIGLLSEFLPAIRPQALAESKSAGGYVTRLFDCRRRADAGSRDQEETYSAVLEAGEAAA